MYDNLGAQPGVRLPSSNTQPNPFGDTFYGASSGFIRGGLGAYGEKILGSSSEYVQSNVRAHRACDLKLRCSFEGCWITSSVQLCIALIMLINVILFFYYLCLAELEFYYNISFFFFVYLNNRLAGISLTLNTIFK